MRINIKTLEGKTVHLGVEPDATIHDIKREYERLRNIPVEEQRLTYAGKQLSDQQNLANYNIDERSTLHLLRPLTGKGAESAKAQTGLDTSKSFTSGKKAPRNGTNMGLDDMSWEVDLGKVNFDEDLHVMNPEAYYNRLASLESRTIQASDFFCRQGSYLPLEERWDEEDGALDRQHVDLTIIPGWMRENMVNPPIGQTVGLESDFDRFWENCKTTLSSLWSSYITLCRTLTSFDTLAEAGFCSNYYSLILEQSDTEVAAIVKLPRNILDEVKVGIESATVQICNGDIHPDIILSHLIVWVQNPCFQVLDMLNLSRAESSTSTASILGLCRSVTLLADLALVSYVGSHVSRFDLDHLNQETPYITVGGSEINSLHFDCRLRRLACLHGFMDEENIWVFRCWLMKGALRPGNDATDSSLSILTHIEEFADIWGPVWSIPADHKPSGLIQQHNVSKGAICRVSEVDSQGGRPVGCHWYNWDELRRRRSTNRLWSRTKPLHLGRDDLLLIGTRIRLNEDCRYTLDQFEAAYGHTMGALGGEPSVWESELESRSASLSFAKVVGVSVTGTQKRRPQTSLKQSILARWKTGPQTANPGILDHFLGVEISHCTGNARRVRIKDLILMPVVRSLLDLQFPQWSTKPWGPPFLAALQSYNPKAICSVWTHFEGYRSDMGALVSFVLETLDKTGLRGDGLVAAFLNNGQESSMLFDHHRNDWANMLKDSHMMASYAIVGDLCIECETPDHSTATCTGEKARTVLETRLGLGTRDVPEFVKVQPSAQVFKTQRKVDPHLLVLTPSALLSKLPSSPIASGTEIRDRAAGGHQLDIILRATDRSYSGMRTQRERNTDQRPALSQRYGQTLASSVPLSIDHTPPEAGLWNRLSSNAINQPTETQEVTPRSIGMVPVRGSNREVISEGASSNNVYHMTGTAGVRNGAVATTPATPAHLVSSRTNEAPLQIHQRQAPPQNGHRHPPLSQRTSEGRDPSLDTRRCPAVSLSGGHGVENYDAPGPAARENETSAVYFDRTNQVPKGLLQDINNYVLDEDLEDREVIDAATRVAYEATRSVAPDTFEPSHHGTTTVLARDRTNAGSSVGDRSLAASPADAVLHGTRNARLSRKRKRSGNAQTGSISSFLQRLF